MHPNAHLTGVALLVLSLADPAAARAGEPTPTGQAAPTEQAAPAEPAAATNPDPTEEARRHYKKGEKLYFQAAYAQALEQFRRSYELSKRPALLFNIARCHESLGQHDQAITRYEQYLTSAPDNAAEIKVRIKNLRALVAARRAGRYTDIVKKVPAKPLPPRARPLGAAGWALAGGGAALLIAGGVLGGLALAKEAELEQAHRDFSLTYPELQDEEQAGKDLELAGVVTLSVGGAVAAAGVTLLLLDYLRGGREQRRVWLAPSIGSGRAGVQAGVRF